jgi:hypothetical protein
MLLAGIISMMLPVMPVHADTAATMTVEKAQVGTAIQDRELQGAATEFDKSVTRVYGWARVSSESVPTKVHFIWSADGKQEADVPVDLKVPSGRLWSSKSVWPAHWKLDVSDDAGKALATQEFVVKN